MPTSSGLPHSDQQGVSAVFQDDPDDVSVRDAALIWAYANLPDEARAPDPLARAAEALLRADGSVSAPNPPLDASNTDFALPLGRVDTRDIAVAVAALRLDNPTQVELAEAASLLLPVALEAKDIRVVPGDGLPGEVGRADGAARVAIDDLNLAAAVLPSIDRLPSRVGSLEALRLPLSSFDLRPSPQAPERRVLRVSSRPRLEASRVDSNVLATFSDADLGCDGTRCTVPEALEIVPPNFSTRPGVYLIQYDFLGLDANGAEAQTTIERFLTVLPDARLIETNAPLTELVLEDGDRLLGVERADATTGAGRIVRIGLNPPELSILREFDGTDGRNPRSGLTLANDGNYYGTTQAGGNSDRGTIYRLTAADEVESVHQFGAASAGPVGKLLLADNGKLYGTTIQSASTAAGTVFEFDPSNQAFTVLHDFSFGDDRSRVQTALIQASDGNLYGASNQGLFQLTLTGDFTDLSADSSSFEPLAPVRVVERDRSIYVTYPSLGGFGRIDRYDVDSGTTSTVHAFGASDGTSPAGGLVLADDGNLYGTTSGGGQFGLGTLYRIDASDRFELLYSFNGESDFARPGVPLTSAGANPFYVPGDGGINALIVPPAP